MAEPAFRGKKSGMEELRRATGAKIVHAPGMRWALAFCLSASACTAPASYTVAGHAFEVPARHDVSADEQIPFRPARPATDSFAFVLDPDMAVDDQVMIEVAARDRRCAGAFREDTSIGPIACASRPPPWRGLRRERRGDASFWRYDLAGGDGPVATCFAPGERGEAPLCTAALPYGELVLTFHLAEERVAGLEAHYDAATALLAAWRRQVRAAPAR